MQSLAAAYPNDHKDAQAFKWNLMLILQGLF